MSMLRCLASCVVLAAQASLPTSPHISFDAPRDYRVGAVSVAVGDFNRDGKPDVVSAGRTIWLLLGNGHASLQPPVEVASAVNAGLRRQVP